MAKQLNKHAICAIGLACLFLLSSPAYSKTIYVKSGAPAGGNGKASQPFNRLADAQDAVSKGDKIKIVAGDGQCLDGGIVLKHDNMTLEGATKIECQGAICKVKEAGPALCNTREDNDGLDNQSVNNDGNAVIVEGKNAKIKNLHISKATRFGIYAKNLSVDVKGSYIRNANATTIADNRYLKCPLTTTLENGEFIMTVPEDELGCWHWAAAFPGGLDSTNLPGAGPNSEKDNITGRAGRYYFSNNTTAAIGFLSNTSKKVKSSVKETIIEDFTNGNIPEDGANAGQYGYAVGGIAVLLSTDGDAKYDLDIKQVNIYNSENPVAGGRSTRDARCTYAAIFTMQHDNSEVNLTTKDGYIGNIGGCDGINNHFGFLPGVKAKDLGIQSGTVKRMVRVNDDTGSGLGPKHKVKLNHDWKNFHIINVFDDPKGDNSGKNPGNQYTDAFEPILAEGDGSSYKLSIKDSTFRENAGNALELRFGGDTVESIATPEALDVDVKIRNNCIYNNAHADDFYKTGDDRDEKVSPVTNKVGRDYHNVHLFLPEKGKFDYVIDARKNYWGRPGGIKFNAFDSNSNATDIIAINTGFQVEVPSPPGQGSSYLNLKDLNSVFDTSAPLKNDNSCF